MTIDYYASATDQIAMLQRGEISSAALLEAHLQRNAALHKKLNAVVATDEAAARRTAEQIDDRRARGEDVGPLGGLPMTIKDTFDLDGLPAVSGAPELVDRPRKVQDAALAARLKAAGAVIWGKTNTPLYAGDAQTYNAVYGVTNNPHNLSRTPGGSSGGSAAALAAGITPLELGSDIGGSLRTPAHSCGVASLKPSWGALPLKGHVPPPPGLDLPDPDLGVAGPMARSVGDLQLLFSVLSASPQPSATLETLAGLRFSVWSPSSFLMSDAVAETVRRASDALAGAGAQNCDQQPEIDSRDLMDVYARLLFPIIFDQVPAAVKTVVGALRPLIGLWTRHGEISFAGAMLAASQSPKRLQKAQAERDAMKRACAAFFRNCDVLIAPVTPVPAIPHNTSKSLFNRKISVDGDMVDYAQLFTWIALANACHLPAAVIPAGTTPEGLPCGVQLIGPEGSDWRILEIAALLERALGAPPRPQL